MKLGITFSQHLIGGDAALVRDFAQLAEELGYHHIVSYDHVLGVNRAAYPDWTGPYTSQNLFHDPFVLFSFMAGITERIEFSPQIVILPQRQAVLVAKQAASLDVLSQGRLRLGIGIGWNKIEYIGLNMNFHDRGKRSEEQIAVMRALWADEHVEFEGEHHTILNAGINPLPTKPLEVWIGGGADATFDRIGRIGDGWLNIWSTPEEAQPGLEKIWRSAEKANRDPHSIGLECWTRMGKTSPDQWRADIEAWKAVGADYLTMNTVYGRGNVEPYADNTPASHLKAMEVYIEHVRDLFD